MAGKNKRKRNNKKNALKADVTEIADTNHEEEINDNSQTDQNEAFNKRSYDAEDNSDTEDQPKRKKKKKPPVSDTSDNKGKKSIRQMKREKHAQRLAEKGAASKDQLASQCITYLSQWKHDKPNWKFMKVKQVWLYKNKFSSKLIPDASWKTLLEYFESAQGNIRNLLLEDANKIISEMDEWTESQKNQQATTNEDEEEDNKETDDKKAEITKPDNVAYKRARDILQCLN